MPGFIKIHRKITDWEWYSDINTVRIFIHLLLTACYKDTRYKGQIVERGSVKTTIPDLAQKTGLTIQQVRTALQHLKSTGEISIKSTNRESLIKVHNYAIYQDIDNDVQQTSNRQATDNQQAINVRTEEEDKEDKENSSSGARAKADNFSLLDYQVADLQRISDTYENDIGVIPSSVVLEIQNYYLSDKISADVIVKAIRAATENNVRTWPYIKAILERCVREKIITADDWQRDQLRKKTRGNSNIKSQPANPTYTESDFFNGG